jgi:hypothetical protein
MGTARWSRTFDDATLSYNGNVHWKDRYVPISTLSNQKDTITGIQNHLGDDGDDGDDDKLDDLDVLDELDNLVDDEDVTDTKKSDKGGNMATDEVYNDRSDEDSSTGIEYLDITDEENYPVAILGHVRKKKIINIDDDDEPILSEKETSTIKIRTLSGLGPRKNRELASLSHWSIKNSQAQSSRACRQKKTKACKGPPIKRIKHR